ncbi:AdoMet-homocysteine methyltransferase [Scheffersomyces xylosifermentans]|uniref:AdoMet-homocysteine methyltransferase n=1 Tax=Scheffersomyces xylosifermentans TaxID=1304137 RepID=UPI00315D13B8
MSVVPSKSIKEAIDQGKLVLDGALGTELEALIPKDSDTQPRKHPLWSGLVLLNQPELVSQIHYNYLKEADVDIVISSTYQISYASLKKYTELTDLDIRDLWKRSITVIVDAIEKYRKEQKLSNKKTYVVGSIGPYASFLADGSEYTGDYKGTTGEEIEKYHLPLLQYFISDERVDAIGFETVPNFTEMKSIIKILGEEFKEKKNRKFFYISFNFDTDTLTDGTPTGDVIEYLNNALENNPILREYMLGIGLNCVDYRKITGIVSKINSIQQSNKSLLYQFIVYPNLAMEYYAEDDEYKAHKDINQWRSLVEEWLRIENVRVVGGCCSTSPAEIREVRELIDKV